MESKLQKMFEPSFQLFDIELFHSRYHRSLANALDTDVFFQDPNSEELIGEEIPQVGIPDDYSDEEGLPFSDKEKYNLIIPHMIKMANLIACHGTSLFQSYLSEITKVREDFSESDGETLEMDVENNNSEIDEEINLQNN